MFAAAIGELAAVEVVSQVTARNRRTFESAVVPVADSRLVVVGGLPSPADIADTAVVLAMASPA